MARFFTRKVIVIRALNKYVPSTELNRTVMTFANLIWPIMSVVLLGSMAQQGSGMRAYNPHYSHTATEKLNVSNEEWERILPANVYYIARQEGTEQAFTGKNWDNHIKGTYYCAVCGNPLFLSSTKFDSGTGWPSFYQPIKASSVKLKTDADGDRVEVECSRCGSHLGHVFDDGPKPTYKRYCMNGNVMDFEKE